MKEVRADRRHLGVEPVHSKVMAGAVGGGMGAAVAAVVVWVLAQLGIDAETIEWAFAVIFSGLGSFAAGYFKTETRAR